MRRAKGDHEVEAWSGRPSSTVEDEVIMTLSRAREMEDRGRFSGTICSKKHSFSSMMLHYRTIVRSWTSTSVETILR